MKKLKWLKKNKIPIVVSLTFLVIGGIAGFAAQPHLPFSARFDEKIDGVELFQIFCTVALVWIVASTLDKRKHTEQSTKALIAKRVDEIYDLSMTINEQIIKGGVKLIIVTSSLKRMSLTVKSVYDSLNNHDLTIDSKHKDEIEAQISKLNDLTTNTPVDCQNGPDLPLKIEDGTLIFGGSRVIEVTAAFDSLREQITNLQLAIFDA